MTTTNVLALSDSYSKCSAVCFYIESAYTYTESYSGVAQETGQEHRQTLTVSGGQSGEHKMMQEYSKRP